MSEEYIPKEVTCPYCNGAGDNIEWALTPKRRYRGQWIQNEIGVHVQCPACRGLRRIIDPDYLNALKEVPTSKP